MPDYYDFFLGPDLKYESSAFATEAELMDSKLLVAIGDATGHDDWSNNTPQVDDVTLVALKVK